MQQETRGEHHIDTAALEQQLERILTSQTFTQSERLCRFLRFVVEKTLRGEESEIKEYVLGLEVFDRGDQYDPRLDPIVRVEARRLRDKLREYYEGEGLQDPLVVHLDKGTYVPTFRVRESGRGSPDQRPNVPLREGSRRAVWSLLLVPVIAGLLWAARPHLREWFSADSPPFTIAVLPLENLSGEEQQDHLADAVTEALITELSKIGGFRVKSRTTVMQYRGARRPLPEIAQELGAHALVEGGVWGAGPEVFLKARLVDAGSDTKIWAGSFHGPIDQALTLQKEVAQSIARKIQSRSVPAK